MLTPESAGGWIDWKVFCSFDCTERAAGELTYIEGFSGQEVRLPICQKHLDEGFDNPTVSVVQ